VRLLESRMNSEVPPAILPPPAWAQPSTTPSGTRRDTADELDPQCSLGWYDARLRPFVQLALRPTRTCGATVLCIGGNRGLLPADCRLHWINAEVCTTSYGTSKNQPTHPPLPAKHGKKHTPRGNKRGGLTLPSDHQGDDQCNVFVDAFCLPFRSGSMDMVLDRGTLDWITISLLGEDDSVRATIFRQIRAEVLRVLRPGGRLAVVTNLGGTSQDSTQYFRENTEKEESEWSEVFVQVPDHDCLQLRVYRFVKKEC